MSNFELAPIYTVVRVHVPSSVHFLTYGNELRGQIRILPLGILLELPNPKSLVHKGSEEDTVSLLQGRYRNL